METARERGEDAAQLLDIIRNRRSIRRYASTPVADEAVNAMVAAATCAPSACNEQPWHFVVVRDRATLDELATRHPFGSPLKGAPLCIVPVVNLEAVTTLFAGDFWVQDMSAATQNLLLAATALGLGAVWIGTYPAMDRVEAVREVLSIPDTALPLCLVPMGHPLERPAPRNNEVAGRIHRERW